MARALAAKARCPVFDSRWRHFLCSPKSFQRSTDSNDADRDLFRQVALRSSDVAPSIGFVFRCSFFYRALLTLMIPSFSTTSTQQLSFNLATITSSMVYTGCEASGCQQDVVARWLEHWQLKPDVLGSIPGSATSFAALSCFKGNDSDPKGTDPSSGRTVTMPIVNCFDRLP